MPRDNPPRLPDFVPGDILLESFTFPFFDSRFDVAPAALAQLFLDRSDPEPARGMKGLYVHIPFCDTLCGFCPFVKSVGTPERIAAYLDALDIEIDLLAGTALAQSWTLDAIYIGGGTPSVLTPAQITRLAGKLRSSFTVSPDLEFTLEVEPKSADEAFCAAAAGAGVNRLSFGVQTFDPAFRSMMNLTATRAQIDEMARLSRQYFQAANFDMIVGYPGQTQAQAEQDMDEALALDVGNISVFPLDYLATMPSLLNKIRRGEYPPPPASARRWDMFHAARTRLAEVYDPMNMYYFSEPGMPGCKYMFGIVYGGYFDEFLGLGASAYSMIRGLAYSNIQSETAYVDTLARTRALPVSMASPGHAYEKSYVYFGKRMRANMDEAAELGIDAVIGPKFEALLQSGLVSRDGADFVLTPAGERVYAQIMVGFLSDAQRRLYDRVCGRMCGQLNWTFDGASSEARAQARGVAARNTMLEFT
ncbi:MAG: radical SAM protein [Oceanicaulis sp.]|nr:radical SAM protein [Oceanicaulis sp.]